MTPLVLQLRIAGLSVGISVSGLFLGLAAGVGAMIVALAGRHAGLGARAALALCFWAASAGLIAARLGGLAAGGETHGLPFALNAPLGLAAALGAAWIFARARGIPAGHALDPLACGLAAAHAVFALGCFAAGCCYGPVADAGAPLAVRFGADTVAWHELAARGLVPLSAATTPPLHPVQLVEAAALTLLAGALVLLARRPRRGALVAVYLASAAVLQVALAP